MPGPHALSRMCEESVMGWSFDTCPKNGFGDAGGVGGGGGLRMDSM